MDIFLNQLFPWFLILIFLIHDGEELIVLPGWLWKHSSRFTNLGNRFPFAKPILSFFSSTNQQQFFISVFFVLAIILAITSLNILNPSDPIIQMTYLGALIIFIFHFLIHGLQSFILRGFVPGTFTSIILFPISAIIGIHHIYYSGYSKGQILFAIIAGVLIFIPGFVAALFTGYWIEKLIRNNL